MQLVQTRGFVHSVKKLHKNQKEALYTAVQEIMQDPELGNIKTGDLAGLRVYKFRMVSQLTLLVYTYVDSTITLAVVAFGSHENLCRDLKQ